VADKRKVEDLFHQLLDAEVDARAQIEQHWMAADPDVLAEALRLVAAFESAASANQEALPRSTGFAANRQFGAYRTVRLLGTGGTGAVYLAERTDGQFTHQVAIKVMGQHVGGPAFERRFHAERQILAGLAHPNIARLLDGNLTEHGEPYLVLEYIDGVPLDTYCEEHQLDRAGRIRLFLKVCAAVEFSHRNLVVHLDLKPSNILVNADGEPKLLDFGASRLLSEVRPGMTVPLLTLRYASPEQLRAQPVSTLSDVFSLGVVLYELLEGTSPFSRPDSWEANLERAIEEVTARPSSLPPDLDTIVRRAMSREPERRYASVRELADDLQRFLDGRPILARPSTLGYRAAKFVRRNRAAVAAAVAVAIVTIGGVASTLWQARIAQKRFHELRQLARYVITDLNTGLQRVPGTTALQRESVERGLRYLDGLAAEAGRDADLRVEVAEGYRSLGDVLGNPFRANLGDRPRAEASYSRGLAILRGLPSNTAVRSISARLNLQLGGVRSFGSDPNAGLDQIRSAVTELKQLAQSSPGDTSLQLNAAQGLEFLGTRVTAGGGNIEGAKAAEAARLFEEAIALVRTVQHPDALRSLAQIQNSQAMLYGSAEPQKAIAFHRAAIDSLSRMAEADASSLTVRRLRASILLNTGWAEGQARAYDASIAHVTEAGAILRAWAEADPENTNAWYQLSGVYRTLGIVHGYRRDAAPAVNAFSQAIAIHERLLQRNPENKVYRFLRAELLLRSGNWLAALGRREDARRSAQSGLTMMTELATGPSASLTHTFGACRWLTETEVIELRQPRLAETFCRHALQRTDNQDPDAFIGLAAALHQLGDSKGAVAAVESALRLLPAETGSAKSQQRQDMESALARFRR